MKKFMLALAAVAAFVSIPAFTRPIASINLTGSLPIVCDSDVIASGGDIRITFPSASGMADGCDIVLANEDSAAGKYLIGAAADINPKLYPNQAVGFTTFGGKWVSKHKPGRYQIPSGTFVYVANAPTGDDTNDGLSTATPLQHNSAATHVVQTDMDTQQSTPFIALQGGATFTNDPISLGGQPTGGNLIGLTVYGSGTTTITNADDAAIIGGDNAELDIETGMLSGGAVALVLQGNINDHAGRAAGIYAHNNFLFDMNLTPAGAAGRTVILGNGPNGSAVFFDGATVGASSSGTIQVAGAFQDIWHMDEGGGRFTLGSIIQPIASPISGLPCSVTRILTIIGSEELLLGGGASQFPAGYASTPGPSIVSGSGLLVTFGISVLGGVTPAQNGHVFPTKM